MFPRSEKIVCGWYRCRETGQVALERDGLLRGYDAGRPLLPSGLRSCGSQASVPSRQTASARRSRHAPLRRGRRGAARLRLRRDG